MSTPPALTPWGIAHDYLDAGWFELFRDVEDARHTLVACRERGRSCRLWHSEQQPWVEVPGAVPVTDEPPKPCAYCERERRITALSVPVEEAQ